MQNLPPFVIPGSPKGPSPDLEVMSIELSEVSMLRSDRDKLCHDSIDWGKVMLICCRNSDLPARDPFHTSGS